MGFDNLVLMGYDRIGCFLVWILEVIDEIMQKNCIC